MLNSVQFPVSRIHFLNRWHPEVAIRYLPIVKKLQATSCPPKAPHLGGQAKLQAILEVGSGWLGIAPYLGKQVTGLDEDFENKNFYLLKQVKGSVLNIPFENNTFEAVVCVDVLEHLPKNQRLKAISELLRVAEKLLFIGVPCGKESYKQDLELDKKYKNVFGKPFTFLEDHLEYGLPEEKEIADLIGSAAKENNKKIKMEVQGNENLKLRKFLMNGWITKSAIIDFVFRKAMLLLISFFPLFEHLPYYRKLFFVRIKP